MKSVISSPANKKETARLQDCKIYTWQTSRRQTARQTNKRRTRDAPHMKGASIDAFKACAGRVDGFCFDTINVRLLLHVLITRIQCYSPLAYEYGPTRGGVADGL